jgi:succinoglycan biosynthesis protein ExoV
MILYQWRGRYANFGDELNSLLWPRLLPGFFDTDPAVHFLGIGSVLDGRHPAAGLKLVAGAGYGGYEPPPRLDANWIIHWVRGPLTARCLGLAPALGLGDPAALLPLAGVPTGSRGDCIGFMPHFESLEFGAWARAAAAAGITLIDPRLDVQSVIAAIRSCRVLLSEAMHGVIVADALRVPWVAIEPLAAVHRPKWLDWADTIGLEIAFRRLPASSLSEWMQVSGLASFHTGRRLLHHLGGRLGPVAADRLVQRAAAALRQAAAATPQLSSDTALHRSQDRMMAALRRLRLAPLTQPNDSPMRSDLHGCVDSAYHPVSDRLTA